MTRIRATVFVIVVTHFPLQACMNNVMRSAMQLSVAIVSSTMVGARTGFEGQAPVELLELKYMMSVSAMTMIMTIENNAVRDC